MTVLKKGIVLVLISCVNETVTVGLLVKCYHFVFTNPWFGKDDRSH